MKKMITKKLFTSLVFSCLMLGLFAQKSNPWADIQEANVVKSNAQRQIIPSKYRTVQLDPQALQSVLNDAPIRFSEASRSAETVLTLPMPDGSNQRFAIVNAPIMDAVLQEKYPNLHSYAGKGIDDPTAYLRFSITHKGLNAMILSSRSSTVFIDPFQTGDTENYVCYYKKDYAGNPSAPFSCGVETPEADFLQNIAPTKSDQVPNTPSALFAGDCQLRTYRLALACTGEYASFHGGNVPDVMAEFVVAMTRVNGVYENDVTVTMELVGNTDQLIFLNAATDPYTNNNGGAMLGQNQTTCNNVIGSSNYDIGHVFSTGGGGIASLAVPCTGSKARGVTGLGSPVGDPFYIDYVAHEMGHQFGANHTQNNSCNRNNSTAMEPGSASTIMGYAGICAPNVQNNSDDHFHAISIQEITNNIEFGNSSGCPVESNTGNSSPSASVASSFYNLPVSTPFALTCIASDPDGDVLTYNWEQMDNEVASMPPSPTNNGGPAFRSNSSVESPTRYFPNLNAINSNSTPTWEVLPSVSRDMSFRCTVRDNFPGGGCRDEVDVDLNFDGNSGPFLVLSPNTNLTWDVGTSETVIWDVANTNAAPVSCSNVDILLSTDGGLTYPITLATGVSNTGNYGIVVPNEPTTTARVKVICSDNIFFDVSDQNFEIELPANPAFIMDVAPTSQSICNTEELVYEVDLTAILGFNEEINLSVAGLPGGATANFDNNPLTPPGSAQLTIGNLSGVPSGTYPMTVNAVANSMSLAINIEMILTDGVPELVTLNSPADGATGVGLSVLLEWLSQVSASDYFIEIATSPAFGNTIIESSAEVGNAYVPQNLEELTVYYWRVRGSNICGDGNFSEVFAFQTTQSSCFTYESNDVPVNIPDDDIATVTSIINVGDDFNLEDVNVSLFIQHSWLGDLSASLSSPSGSSIDLFDQPGVPDSNFGCDGNDVLATFDDAAPNSSFDFENTCEASIPSIFGNFQPIEPLSDFNNENSLGVWTLTVDDAFNEDGGMINSWSLELCSSVIIPAAPNLLTNNILTVQNGESGLITNAYLEANSPSNSAAQIVFTLIAMPANGTLVLDIGGNPTTLNLGDQFTQEDINNNLLSYTHDGSLTTSDSFDFDVVNNENGWLHESTFHINIVEDDLSASANLDNGIDCFDNDNAQISVTANGAATPFEYSLDGINFQSENVFNNLAPGAYTFTVKDANGLTTTTNEIIVNNAPQIVVSADVVNDDITVTASGGTGNLTYSIDGINFQGSNVFSNLDNGVYTIYVKDENGCIVETEAIVAVNVMVVMAELVTELECFDDSDASIEVSVGGGTPDFTYSLDGINFQSSNIFDGLAAGAYTVTVMDGNGDTAETNEIVINNPSQIIISTDVAMDVITVTASGGTGDLMYSLDGVNFQSSNIFSGLAVGDYTVYVMDANGCIAQTSATVIGNTMLVSAILATDLDCFNGMNASIEVTVEGGTPDFTYSLDGINFQSSNIFNGLAAGAYTITVMDDNGFVATTNEVIIANPVEITASSSVSGYDITVTASGGTGALTYSLDGINFQSSNIFIGNSNGNYSIIVMDENGCQIEISATVDVDALSVETTHHGLSCHDFNDGVIIAAAFGGVPPYQYSIDGINFQDEPEFSGLSEGSYTITMMDSGGFMVNSSSIFISNPDELLLEIVDDANNVTLNGSGGTAPYQYSIDGVNYGPDNEFPDLENGLYTFYIQDANGCVTEEMILIDISAIDDLRFDLSMAVHPNPSNGNFTVSIKQKAASNLNFKVFDVTGKLLFSEELQFAGLEIEKSIDLEYLPSGTYHLVVSNDKQIGVEKLVVLK